MRLRRSLAFTVALVLLLAATEAGDASAAPPLPRAMAAVGDSITRAFDADPTLFGDQPVNSWSTGVSDPVRSHYSRLLAMGAGVRGKNHNDAASGARMADLSGQMAMVNTQAVGYVTVLMGANDVCTPSEESMTSVPAFAIQFRIAMRILTLGSPTALVYVVSMPDVYDLWSVLKDNERARFIWAAFGICQSMLANPLSNAPADVARRARVRQRAIDLNAQLRLICGQEFATTCRDDRGAAFKTKITAADVSALDYFHPSLAGQQKLAAVTWAAGSWGRTGGPASRE